MGRKLIDLRGRKFGRLTVIERIGTKNRKSVWECKCECGNTKEVVSNNLISGNTKSCGCLKYSKKGLTQKDEKHLKLWHIHRDIIRRCTNKKTGDIIGISKQAVNQFIDSAIKKVNKKAFELQWR